jgi:hypothetical protein
MLKRRSLGYLTQKYLVKDVINKLISIQQSTPKFMIRLTRKIPSNVIKDSKRMDYKP